MDLSGKHNQVLKYFNDYTVKVVPRNFNNRKEMISKQFII